MMNRKRKKVRPRPRRWCRDRLARWRRKGIACESEIAGETEE